MNRILAMALSLLVMACNTVNQSHRDTYLHKINDSMSATVQIFSESGARGSGFHIGDGYIVTAYHVIESPDYRIMWSDGSDFYQATLMAWNEGTDLALLRMNEYKNIPHLNISQESPKIGEIIYTIGYHFGVEELKLFNSGIMTNTIDLEGDLSDFMVFSSAINPGASGGPVLNENFEVVGINQLIYTTSGSWAGVGLSTKLDNVKVFINSVLTGKLR